MLPFLAIAAPKLAILSEDEDESDLQKTLDRAILTRDPSLIASWSDEAIEELLDLFAEKLRGSTSLEEGAHWRDLLKLFSPPSEYYDRKSKVNLGGKEVFTILGDLADDTADNLKFYKEQILGRDMDVIYGDEIVGDEAFNEIAGFDEDRILYETTAPFDLVIVARKDLPLKEWRQRAIIEIEDALAEKGFPSP